MLLLLSVSLLWAFSFGLIKTNLHGLDPNLVAWMRFVFALPLFLIMLKRRHWTWPLAGRLMFIGGIQYGVMYTVYISAYRFLQAYEVALFTIFTPFYIILFSELWARKFHPRLLIPAAFAVIGAAIIQYQTLSTERLLAGLGLMQISGICFAFGQVAYRQLKNKHPQLQEHRSYAWMFIGAILVTTLTTTFSHGWQSLVEIQSKQLWTLAYLGFFATGLGFFAWNKGATQVRPEVLAVMNNLKIPLGVGVSLVVFGEHTDILRLLLGGGVLLLAFMITERWRPSSPKTSSQAKIS